MRSSEQCCCDDRLNPPIPHRAGQKPAHSLRTNVTDGTYVRKQMRLMHDVDEVLINIRQWLASHPRNHAWTDPLSGLKDYLI